MYCIVGNISGHKLWLICYERRLVGLKSGGFCIISTSDVTE